MKSISASLLSILLLFINTTQAQDMPGSKDHPLITRYPGSVIGYYEEQKFKTYDIAVGPQTGYKKIDDWFKTEGKFTRIYYILKGETTLLEVYINYMSALKKAGFKILAEGIHAERNVSQEVGGTTFIRTFYESNPYPTNKGIKISMGSGTSAGACYIAAQLEKAGSNVYVVLGGSQYAADEKVFLLDIIEQTVMEDDLVKINAAEMLKGIKTDGKIALYGIYFDFDKAEVKPESEQSLIEISKLLKENPSLNLYVVGHTDMKGAYDYNMTLSKQRAEAVVNELVKKYGIAASRLTAAGAGPLAPVSTNQTEDGRKLNRRVELVER